jgi:hypothetical protein
MCDGRDLGLAFGQGDDSLVIERYSMPSSASSLSVSAQNAGTSVSSVTFNAFGQVKGAAPIDKIKIQIPDSDVRSLEVHVTSGGLIRMCDPSVGKADSRAGPDAT